MTTINIYENSDGESSYILQEDMVDELKDIKSMIKDLQDENIALKKLILDLKKNVLKKLLVDLKKNVSNEETGNVKKGNTVSAKDIQTVKVDKTVKKTGKKRRIRLQDSDKFKVLPSEAKVLFKNMELLPTGLVQHGNNTNRKYTLKYNIYDILYIKSVSDSESFSMNDFRRLYEQKKDWDRFSMYKIIYNIRNNVQLKEIIETARNVLEKDMKFSKKNNLLYIDGVNTEIPVHQVRDWCTVYMNSNKSRDKFIWELQSKFTSLNKDYIAIIIYNHSNNNLLDVLKKGKGNPFIENNPSKRKNLILNGGMV